MTVQTDKLANALEGMQEVAKDCDKYLNRIINEAEQKQIKIDRFESQEELKHLNLLFDLRHKADVRAIEMWQKKTGRDLTIPDQADMCVFLLEENNRLRDALVQIKSVCIDNEQDTCNKEMALKFVYDVATEALTPPEGSIPDD